MITKTAAEQTDRPSWDEVFMRFAHELSRRSTCSRLKVGCVIVSEDNHIVLSMGYNGGAKGVFNECMSDEPGKCGHLHAEINALLKLDYNSPCAKRMYVTTSPCHSCAVAIVNAGIGEVVYATEYRDDSGVRLLADGCVLSRRYDGGEKR